MKTNIVESYLEKLQEGYMIEAYKLQNKCLKAWDKKLSYSKKLFGAMVAGAFIAGPFGPIIGMLLVNLSKSGKLYAMAYSKCQYLANKEILEKYKGKKDLTPEEEKMLTVAQRKEQDLLENYRSYKADIERLMNKVADMMVKAERRMDKASHQRAYLKAKDSMEYLSKFYKELDSQKGI